MTDVFAALADPTRRRILDEVGRRGTATTTQLAAGLPVTRQAVAKHLGVLGAAGLVASQHAGRETHYRVTPEPLDEAIRWMGQWDARLDRLARSVR